MRFEVKAQGQGKTYTVLKVNSLPEATCFAETFFRNNTYQRVFVTRRGETTICQEGPHLCEWVRR